jgi:rhamnose transport system substrate-binding protein
VGFPRPRLPHLLHRLRPRDGQLTGEIGETFTAGRMGDYTIEEDPGRPGSKRILMGPFTVYNSENVEAAAQ